MWIFFLFAGIPGIIKIMTRARFLKLQRYLHLNDNSTIKERCHPEYDSLHKIRPLLSRVQDTIKECYNPGQNLAIDESKVGFMGRSSTKQNLLDKPAKGIFKVWSLADSSNGYVSGMDIYSGRRANPSNNGLGYDVVTSLMADHMNKYHHCYFDSFFTSVKLLDDLLVANTYACGTIYANRVGLPAEIKTPRYVQRGESIKMQRKGMVAVVWYDKRDIRIISTNSQPTDHTVQRSGRNLTDVTCPTAILNYQKNIGGVHHSDQLRGYYDIGRNAKKKWKCLMWHLLSICIVNSYIIYKETMQSFGKRPQNQLQFRQKLINQLIGGFTSRKRDGRRGPDVPAVEEGQFPGHFLVRSTKRVCRNCSQLGNKTIGGGAKQCAFKCQACDVNLCRGGCLIAFHTRHMSTKM